MSAILLEINSETGLFRACRCEARRQYLPCAARAFLLCSSWLRSRTDLRLWDAIQTTRNGGFLADKRVFGAQFRFRVKVDRAPNLLFAYELVAATGGRFRDRAPRREFGPRLLKQPAAAAASKNAQVGAWEGLRACLARRRFVMIGSNRWSKRLGALTVLRNREGYARTNP